MRYTVVALIAAAAVPLAACGSSSSPTGSSTGASGASTSPSTSNSTGAAPHGTPNAKADHVAGLIASVAGNTVTVNQKNGTATVDFTDATKIAEVDAATLTDVTAASCVSIRPTKDSAPNGPVTARSVLVSPANNGQCAGPGQNGRGVRGAVASVSANTITVSSAGNQTSVTVTPDTRYTKLTSTSASAIAQGKCLAAHGTKDGSGALQATSITVRAANNGNCGGSRR
jgi:hypothetical protein